MEYDGTIIEIERKWVLKNLPEIEPGCEALEINYAYTKEKHRYQEYIDPKNPDKRRYNMVFKKGEGLSREETTIPITEGDYIEQAVSPDTAKISKIRYMVPFEDGHLEIDDYKNLRLVTMEYEIKAAVGNPFVDKLIESFKTKEFAFPEEINRCIIKEVTGEGEYSNLNLAIIQPLA